MSPLHVRSPVRALVLALAAAAASTACAGGEDAGEGQAAPDGPPATEGRPLLDPNLHDATAPDSFDVRLVTTEGDVRIRVRRAWAPRGADRFYNLVRAGYYDGVTFHRVLEGFVAEFGIHPDPWVNAAWRQARLRDDPVVRSNARGTLSFSKSTPHTRTTQVFVNTDDNPELDGQGFAPFGEVTEGMDVVEALYADYGDGPPRGEGVYKAMAIARGDEYLDAEFPELDRIERAEVVGIAGGPPE